MAIEMRLPSAALLSAVGLIAALVGWAPVDGAAAPTPRRPRPLPPPAAHGRPGTAVPVLDPARRALTPFHAALARAAKRKGFVRIAVYGASHTAADLWTGELRRLLQAKFGEGGHGFAVPLRWNPGYRHQDLIVESTPGWLALRHLKADGAAVGDYGYGGVVLAAPATATELWTEIRTTVDNPLGRRFDRLELWVRAQPGGGDIEVTIDGAPHVVPTRADTESVQFETWKLKDKAHVVRLRPLGTGAVVVYGLVTERSRGGAVVDQLGIPGMRAEVQLHWAEARWAQQVARRSPDLVVLAYGTNDVADAATPDTLYREQWREVLARVRRAAPQAACVIVGPTDRLVRGPDGRKEGHPRTPDILAVQRAAAAEASCAHWDAQAAMGGPGAMVRWRRHRLAPGDDVHLNRAGYLWLAELFAWALLRDAGAR
ncbi:MAG: hypothetical protein EXR79_09285 [Myxococcales bacterium]|nr:hypothetical protein [Myxococcales bacterium]